MTAPEWREAAWRRRRTAGDRMTSSGQLTTSALQALLQDGKLAGTMDAGCGQVRDSPGEQAHVGASAAPRRLPRGHRERHGDGGRGGQGRHHRGRRLGRHEIHHPDKHLRSADLDVATTSPSPSMAEPGRRDPHRAHSRRRRRDRRQPVRAQERARLGDRASVPWTGLCRWPSIASRRDPLPLSRPTSQRRARPTRRAPPEGTAAR